MKFSSKLQGFAAAGLLAGSAVALTACSQAQPAISQCAIVTNNGFGASSQDITALVRPGGKVDIGNNQIAWYYPCDARNYVTMPVGGDRQSPMSVRTGPGKNQPGMPVQVWTAVYWTPNESDAAMKAFLPFCLKYGCASQDYQTDQSVADSAHFSTPGWNGMLAENFGPAIDRATQDVIGQFGPDLWVDHSQWSKLGTLIAQNLDAELAKETGSSIPFFCGDSSTPTTCTSMQVVVNNVTPTDPQVQQLYDQQIAAENSIAVNTARLNAAKELYGPYAQYFLGLEDLANQCKTCTIYVGAPNTVPTAPAGK